MGNIVQLPSISDRQLRRREEVQLELFGHHVCGSNFVTFIDVENLNQDSLIDIVTKNAVVSILDIRARPVFRRPNFVHAEIFRYLEYRKIHYFDYAVVAADPAEHGLHAIARRVNHGRGNGLTLCLYDESSNQKGWVEEARRTLRRSKLFRAELSRSALA